METGNIVRPWEYATLRAIDRAFCEETNKELADYYARLREQQEAEAAAKAAKGKRRG